jgi:hypothetical protein
LQKKQYSVSWFSSEPALEFQSCRLLYFFIVSASLVSICHLSKTPLRR